MPHCLLRRHHHFLHPVSAVMRSSMEPLHESVWLEKPWPESASEGGVIELWLKERTITAAESSSCHCFAGSRKVKTLSHLLKCSPIRPQSQR